ncbi:helix-hairpin-helix domain-containing protein [Marinitoga litoralis]|uniref:helix-hairpin-helix domain-containing protein n=1 Tax=Marinitoga litoralis TaxID=570855 RepID=UPI00196076F9|nr:competence protein ComEA [Marinitoga litoralis]
MYKKIDLSNFTLDELLKIPGIGYKKAEKIKEYYDTYGFSSVEDLKKVSGIGEKTFEKIKSYFYISETVYIIKENKKININNASFEELIKLPSIGEKTAQKIINYRNIKNINSLDDLKNILTNYQINQIKGVVEF